METVQLKGEKIELNMYVATLREEYTKLLIRKKCARENYSRLLQVLRQDENELLANMSKAEKRIKEIDKLLKSN